MGKLLFLVLALCMESSAVLQGQGAAPPVADMGTDLLVVESPAEVPNEPILSRYAADTLLLNLFDGQETLLWIKRFRGYFDDAHDIELQLGFDGLKVRGFLQYRSSRERFRLDGSLSGTVMQLEERDSNEYVTGYWSATLQANQLKGTWTNAAQTLGGSFDLAATEALPTDHKWLNRYVSRWNQHWMEVYMLRAYNGALFGSIYSELDRETLPLKGEIDSAGNYVLESPVMSEELRVELTGQMRYLQVSNTFWHHPNGESRRFLLSLKDQLLLQLYDWADYTSMIDVLYPRTKCAACNTFLDTMVQQHVQQARHLFSIQSQPKLPANRSIHQSNAWTELTYWSDDYLGGYVLFAQNLPNSKDPGFSFLFDLQAGRPLTMAELFVKNFDYKAWFADYARKVMPEMQGYAENHVYRKWLHHNGFSLITVQHGAFCLSTGFHPVFGEQRLQVPFELVQDWIKDEHPIFSGKP